MTHRNPYPRAAEHATLWCVVLSVAALVISACVVAGCVAPDPVFVEAMRATHDVVSPRQRTYLEGDDGLTPEQRDRRLRTLTAWGAAIETAEEELNGDSAD